MAQVFTGDREIFRAMSYTQPDTDYLDHVSERYESAVNNLTGTARDLMTNLRNKYQEVRNSDSVRKAKAILRQTKELWGRDVIRQLNNVTDVQNAPLSMRRYLMAEPTIRKLYHNGQCEGYGKSYVDLQPGIIGDDHLDYQKVNNGYMHVNDDGSWLATTYSNNFADDDGEVLDLDQQDDVRSAWDIIRTAVLFDVDPTSKRDADL